MPISECRLPCPACGRAVRGKSRDNHFLPSELASIDRSSTLSPRRPGGEGGSGPDQPVRGTAHLTLPPLSAHACVRLSGGASPMRQGSSLSPLKGGEGFYRIGAWRRRVVLDGS